jgi:hypothetical protein
MVCHTGLLDHDVPSWSCSQAVSKPVWHIPLLCVQWKTPNDGQRNCPKHVEFYSKNKFEKLVYLVGFIIRNYLTMPYAFTKQYYWLYILFWISFWVQVFALHIIKYFANICLGHCFHVQQVGVLTLSQMMFPSPVTLAHVEILNQWSPNYSFSIPVRFNLGLSASCVHLNSVHMIYH